MTDKPINRKPSNQLINRPTDGHLWGVIGKLNFQFSNNCLKQISMSVDWFVGRLVVSSKFSKNDGGVTLPVILSEQFFISLLSLGWFCTIPPMMLKTGRMLGNKTIFFYMYRLSQKRRPFHKNIHDLLSDD